jgi:hypothetical protein
MGGAMSGLFRVIQVLAAVCFYGVLGAIAFMLYRVSKDLADFKRSLTDMEERIMLALLPREARPDKAGPV